MTKSLNKPYLLETYMIAAKTEVLELFQMLESSNLDSKDIRRQKKKLNEMLSDIDDGLKKALEFYKYFYEYDYSFEDSINKRKLQLESLLHKYQKYIKILTEKEDSLEAEKSIFSVQIIKQYFILTKNIYNDELSNIQNILDNNRQDDKMLIIDGVLHYVTIKDFEVEIGNNVTEIKPYAFYMNPYIRHIKISGNSLKHINQMTFAFCPNLEKIILSDSIESFDHLAIYNCPKLNYLELPNNIKNIYSDSICHCKGLISIFKIDNDSCYKVVNNVIMNNDDIVMATNTSIIPNVALLGNYSFSNNSCLAIQIPKSVKTIETGAFISSDIYEIIIPETVTDIKTMAFVDCNNLTRVVILNKQLSFEKSSFIFCPNLKEIVCPKQFQGKIDNLVESNSEVKFTYY